MNSDFAYPSTADFGHNAPRLQGETTAIVCDARGSVALPHGKIRKTHYWHKKSQFGKRPQDIGDRQVGQAQVS